MRIGPAVNEIVGECGDDRVHDHRLFTTCRRSHCDRHGALLFLPRSPAKSLVLAVLGGPKTANAMRSSGTLALGLLVPSNLVVLRQGPPDLSFSTALTLTLSEKSSRSKLLIPDNLQGRLLMILIISYRSP